MYLSFIIAQSFWEVHQGKVSTPSVVFAIRFFPFTNHPTIGFNDGFKIHLAGYLNGRHHLAHVSSRISSATLDRQSSLPNDLTTTLFAFTKYLSILNPPRLRSITQRV